MKSKAINTKVLLVSVGVMFLSACGGGGSDSGGAQKNVTSCIAEESSVNSAGFTETTLTNACDFAVNLGRGLITISAIVTLESGGSDTSILTGSFIACRPPSQPYDRDDSVVGRDFDCTD